MGIAVGGMAVVAGMALWTGPGAASASVGSPAESASGALRLEALGSPSPIHATPRTEPASTPAPTPAPTPAAVASSNAAPGRASQPPSRIALTASVAPATTLPAKAAPAPTTPLGFKPRDTVVPMAFPLAGNSGYRYGELWRVPRLGVVHGYNQIRGVTSRGVLLRAHDGVDLPVRNGTLVLAPFAGVVVNPATIWKPWDPQRYGTVVVIRSTEAQSRGYLVILAHLSRRSVVPGDSVRRGQVVGRTGQTGNAAGTPPHLHFELRAPFAIAYAYAGVRRSLDVFDPLPSLHDADPNC